MTNLAALLERVELDRASDERKDCVVASEADVVTGVINGTFLTDENVACDNRLATEALDATHFRVGIATVARRTLTFFMRHRRISYCQLREKPKAVSRVCN